jgi:nitric oxide reductase NorD protein
MLAKDNPLTAEQIQNFLDDFLGLILSEQRTLTPQAAALAQCSHQQQQWVMQWVKTLIRENLEMAYQFTIYAPKALALIREKGLDEWITEAISLYDKMGLQTAITHLENVETYAQTYQQKHTGLPLADIQAILHTFLIGLDGRKLELASSEVTFTDTHTLFLPISLNRFVQRHDNFLLYKAMTVHLWAQTWFGTWRRPLSTIITRFHHREKIIRLFHTLERLRLDACLARELPGLYRDMGHLLTRLSEQRVPTGWEEIAHHLAQTDATVENSYQLLETVQTWPAPPAVCYQGILLPEQVEHQISLRQAEDKKTFQSELAQLKKEKNHTTNQNNENSTDCEKGNEASSLTQGMNTDEKPSPSSQAQNPSPQFDIEFFPETHSAQRMTPILTIDGQPVAPSENLKKVMDSIVQDQGSIPQNYLEAPTGGEDFDTTKSQSKTEGSDSKQSIEDETFLYPEWDYRRQCYYQNWCVLREVETPLQSEQFINDTLQRHHSLLKTLRRTFEKLRGANQYLKKQPDGDDIDLDALINSYSDARQGLEMSQHVFTKMHKIARDIAVVFMVDMSGSTTGWINQAERESLVLLCEVLETLGDRYAIYGFSGLTRKRCDIYPIKRFEESYTLTIRQRISGIAPQDYTRMGVAIRHLTQILKKIDAKIKILMTLSDGKPNDEGDNYRGTYGIEDTRQALLEAKHLGIHPFCITIDTEAKMYLPRMYGTVNYTVIDKVEQLPIKVSDIYRKLTV